MPSGFHKIGTPLLAWPEDILCADEQSAKLAGFVKKRVYSVSPYLERRGSAMGVRGRVVGVWRYSRI